MNVVWIVILILGCSNYGQRKDSMCQRWKFVAGYISFIKSSLELFTMGKRPICKYRYWLAIRWIQWSTALSDLTLVGMLCMKIVLNKLMQDKCWYDKGWSDYI